jgi:hypothetical protein
VAPGHRYLFTTLESIMSRNRYLLWRRLPGKPGIIGVMFQGAF